MSSLNGQKVSSPSSSRPSTSASKSTSPRNGSRAYSSFTCDNTSSSNVSIGSSKGRLLVEDMEQEAECLPSLDVLLKELRTTLHNVVLTAAPEDGKQTFDKPKTPEATPRPQTTVLTESECKREDDGTIVYKLNKKFIKKRKSTITLTSENLSQTGSMQSLADKTAHSYNSEAQGKRGQVVETMLDGTYKRQEDEFTQNSKDRARQKHLKEVAHKIKLQMDTHINAQLQKIEDKEQKGERKPDKRRMSWIEKH